MTLVRDRSSGELVEQPQFGQRRLQALYGSWWGRLLQPWLTLPWFSELSAWTSRSPRSRSRIAPFASRYRMNLDDFEQPVDGWASFADFFVRQFADGARPLPTDEKVLTSPADGKLLLVPLDGRRLHLKGIDYSVADLVGDPSVAALFEGGTAVVVRLSVDDAHRFYHPASGQLVTGRSTRRWLHTVSDSGRARFLVTNSRRWRLFDSDLFGPLLVVPVGALLVGRIVLTDHHRAERGAEAGRFELGGSTIVMVLPPDRVRFDADLVATSAQGLETIVRAREGIGRMA